MKPAPFDFVLSDSLEEALAVLTEAGEDARILAGGQTLTPLLNMRLVEPAVLIDISGLHALDYIRCENGYIEVGAATTQVAVETWPDLPSQAPLLAQALPHVGHFQTRNRGTVCGSLAFADPSAELPLCLALLEGEVMLQSSARRRVVKAADFQLGMLSTARQGDEMITAARFPVAEAGAGYAFTEMALRHGDFALAAVAVMASAGRLRVAVGGVADRPLARNYPADLGGDALDDALNELAWDLAAADDHHATARYRRELVRRLGRQTVEEALTCRA
jgi:2-furoyl-CoA dehydrogenase FAD binding subunit